MIFLQESPPPLPRCCSFVNSTVNILGPVGLTGLLLKGLATGRTAVGPLSTVDAGVRLQVVLGGELFAALGAGVGLLPLFQHHLGPHLRERGSLIIPG